ncbi:MAG TPA: MFS transporter [Blastocatellia bacterium]|nr:MFS transporter [Blastocatellia bacterium]
MSQATAAVTTESPLPEGTSSRSVTAAYFAAFVAMGLTTASLGPTLPGLAENTQARLGKISFLFMARSLGFLLGAFRGGKLYDRMPGHRVMAAMMMVMAAMMALVPAVPVLWALVAVMLALGAAESTLDAGGNTLLVWAYGEKVGPLMNGLHFCYGLGAFISPIIVAQVLSYRSGIALAYWSLALLVLPVAFWLLRLPGPTTQAASQRGAAGPVNYQLIALVALLFFLYVGAEVSFGGWIYTYAVRLNLGSAKTAAYLTSAFWGSLTIGRLLAIPLAVRFRPRTILLADLLGGMVSIVVMLLWPHSSTVVWLGTFGTGLAMASIFPTTLSFAGRRMKITGQTTGWFLVGASAGAMTMPWLIGQLFESTGARVTMLVILLSLAAATGVFAALMRHSATPAAGGD